MDYSNNPDIVFLAIPKTGTRSVVDYLKTNFQAKKFPGTHTHTEIVPPPLKKHFCFTVVRNPFDRMISYWWSTCQCEGASGMGLKEFLSRPMRPNIKEFQHPYLVRNKINKIIRFEQLEEHFKELPFFVEGTKFGWLNPTIRASEKNPNPRPSTNELLTPEIQDIIRNKFRKDFKVCGYSTEWPTD